MQPLETGYAIIGRRACRTDRAGRQGRVGFCRRRTGSGRGDEGHGDRALVCRDARHQPWSFDDGRPEVRLRVLREALEVSLRNLSDAPPHSPHRAMLLAGESR
jgi:hypothetical protein